LGAALEGLGDKKGAIAAYDKYVALEKSPAKAKFVEQAKAELAKLDPSRTPVAETPPVYIPSTSSREEGSSLPPSRGDAVALRAQADDLRKSNRMSEAAAAYKRAIEADRANLDLYNDLGNVY